MDVARDTAAVMVTHDGERFLAQQCESIFRQTLLPDVLIVVDDASSDGSRPLLREIARSAPIPVEIILTDGSGARDRYSRIAANVTMGLRAVGEHDLVLLADQDDEWLVDRLAGQRAILRNRPDALLVAGNAVLIDEASNPIEGTLRDRFPVPADWATLSKAEQARAAIRRPLVSGATSALRRELVDLMATVPPGWLHDRWATMVAVARGGLVLQAEPVIKYRVHAGQVVGDRKARLGSGSRRWRQVLARGTSPVGALARASHVARRIRPLATDESIRAELSWYALLRSATERT